MFSFGRSKQREHVRVPHASPATSRASSTESRKRSRDPNEVMSDGTEPDDAYNECEEGTSSLQQPSQVSAGPVMSPVGQQTAPMAYHAVNPYPTINQPVQQPLYNPNAASPLTPLYQSLQAEVDHQVRNQVTAAMPNLTVPRHQQVMSAQQGSQAAAQVSSVSGAYAGDGCYVPQGQQVHVPQNFDISSHPDTSRPGGGE